MFNKKIISLSIAVAITTGCSSTHTPDYEKTKEKHIISANDKFEEIVTTLKPTLSNIGEERKGYFVNKDNFYVEKRKKTNLPLVFRKNISYTLESEKTASDFSAEIFKITGIQTDFINSNPSSKTEDDAVGLFADSTGSISVPNTTTSKPSDVNYIKPFNFSGTVEELINYVGIVNELKWKYDEKADKVFLYELSTETFYVYEQNLDISSKNKITTDSNGDSGGNSSVGNKQDIEFSKKESAWDSIEDGIEKFVSEKGKFSFNRRQGTIIVQDNDYVLAKIRNYVEDINKEATRSITVDVSILNVTLNNSKSMGLNWQYVNESLKSSLLGGFDMGVGLGQTLTGDDFGGNLLSIKTNNGLNALVGMLGTVGSVSIQSSQTFPTLNNNPVSFQVTRNEKFIASIDRKTDETTGDENIQTETETVKDGITLTLTPRIIGEQVLIDYSMSLNVHDGFAPSPVAEVQLPISSNKNFNQSIIANNGQTTVIMAFNKETDRTKSQSPFSDTLWMIGGNESHSKQKEIVVITSTPYFSIK